MSAIRLYSSYVFHSLLVDFQTNAGYIREASNSIEFSSVTSKKIKLWNYGIFQDILDNNIQEAYLPKTSIVGQIVSEAQLCSDDSVQILLNLTWV